MHVVLMVLGGFLLQAFFLLTGILWGSFPQAVLSACRLFIPVWVAVALINLYVGVFRAGYRELDSVCTRRTGVTVYVRGV